MTPGPAIRLACVLLATCATGWRVGGAEPGSDGFRPLRVAGAVVSVSDRWREEGPVVPVWIHLHGAPAVVEGQRGTWAKSGVLINITLPGLSKVYADRFAAKGALAELLATVEAALRSEAPEATWRWGTLTITSFSAGFGGVRQLLRDPAAFERIDRLVMLDSIYCGYAGDPAEKRVDPELMDGFARFARLAAEGRKQMVVSHSAQVPPGYASTTETADYLLAATGGVRQPANEPWPGGLMLVSRARLGGLEILGFAGSGPEDHMRHLRALGAIAGR